MTTMAEKIYDDNILQRNNSVEQRSYSELRKVATLNMRERDNCRSRTDAIDREKRCLRAQLNREEHELRAQLGRLELEKQALDEGEVFEVDLPDCDASYDDGVLHREMELTNPYPVTLGRPRQPSESSRDGSTGRGARRLRKLSSNQEPKESYSKILPPLESSSRHSLISGSLVSSKSDTGFSACALSAPPCDEDNQCWVGEPEAISSVRRPRKTLAQQRSESHVWKRSRSLKENARPSNGGRTGTSIGRSQSLRDGKCGGRTPVWTLGQLSPAESQGSNLSRSSSLRGSDLQLSIECLTIDATTEAELNRGPVHRCLRRHLGRSSSAFSKHAVLGSSPDTKSTVWGWIKDVDPNSDTDSMKSLHLEDIQPEMSTDTKPEGADKLKRKSSAKRRPRSLANLKSASDSVGVVGNTPLIPSPSHLSVEKCYELLASAPIGASRFPQNTALTKLDPISSTSD